MCVRSLPQQTTLLLLVAPFPHSIALISVPTRVPRLPFHVRSFHESKHFMDLWSVLTQFLCLGGIVEGLRVFLRDPVGSRWESSPNNYNLRAQEVCLQYPSAHATEAVFHWGRWTGSSVPQRRVGKGPDRRCLYQACLQERHCNDGWKRRHCAEGRSIAATEASVFLSQ